MEIIEYRHHIELHGTHAVEYTDDDIAFFVYVPDPEELDFHD